MESQLYSGKPFRDLFILAAATLALSIVAVLESLQNTIALYSFLPFVALFSSMMIRSYYLMLLYQKMGHQQEPKVKELPSIDKIWTVLFICGFFLFLLLAVHFLGWILA